MATPFTADGLMAELDACGITHLIWLPDSETGHMYRAIQQGRQRLVRICREGEAIPIAAGLLAGGAHPAVFIQSTGFFESGDSVRGVALELRLPLLMLIGYRGYVADATPRDSAARFLEPNLKSWGIPYRTLAAGSDVTVIRESYQQAQHQRCPVAVLVAKEAGE